MASIHSVCSTVPCTLLPGLNQGLNTQGLSESKSIVPSNTTVKAVSDLWFQIRTCVEKPKELKQLSLETRISFLRQLREIKEFKPLDEISESNEISACERMLLTSIEDLVTYNLTAIESASIKRRALQTGKIASLKEPKWFETLSKVELFIHWFDFQSEDRFGVFFEFEYPDFFCMDELKRCSKNLKILARTEKQEGTLVRAKLKALVIHLREELESYKSLIEKIQELHHCQLRSLDHCVLGLPAPLPLESYSHSNDTYYQKHQEYFDHILKVVPEEFPLEVLDFHSREGTRVSSFKDFKFFQMRCQALKDNHELMEKCLPKHYPIRFPNILKPQKEADLVITESSEFKSLVSAYVTYFNQIGKTLRHLNQLHWKTFEREKLVKEMLLNLTQASE